MTTSQVLRRVPWTCRWGRFGGPVPPMHMCVPGFVFWTCECPRLEADSRLPGRGACEHCPDWEPRSRVAPQ